MTKLHEREPKPGDRFKLKNGEIVRFGALFPDDLNIPQRLAVVCKDASGEGAFIRHYSYPSGQYNTLRRCCYDIDCYYEEPKTIKAWVNIYPRAFSRAHVSKDYADKEAGSDRIACKEIEITYTPGDGLS